MNGAYNDIFCLPRPLGPLGEVNKGQILLNFNNKINFKGFYTKFFVFLKI